MPSEQLLSYSSENITLGQSKDYEIGICCFSTKNAALKSKNKDRLGRNLDDVNVANTNFIVFGLTQGLEPTIYCN
jgi:hypothetical protein